MRKFYCIVFIFVVSFLGVFDVKADVTTPHHIYHVNELNINTGSQMITFNGFAFIDHRDNYGGVNLETRIEAYSGSDTLDLGNVTYIQNNVYDYYYARCMDSSNGTVDYCSSSHAAEVASANRRDNNCNNRSLGSDCAYFNVDFKGEIDLAAVYEHFGNDKDISFRIITTNDSAPSMSSNFGVSYNNCYVNGTPGMCGNGGAGVDIGLASGSLKVSGVTNQVRATITQGRARYTNFTMLGSGYYYKQEGIFTTRGYYKGGNFSKNGGLVSFNSNYYIISGGLSGTTVVPGGSESYVIFDSWVQAAQALKIVFNDVEEIPKLEEYKCLAGYTNVKNSNMNAVCDNNTHTLQTCKKENIGSITVSYELTADELAKANDGGQSCADSMESKTIDDTSNLGILIHQKGEFTFGDINSSVYAGKGFKFPTLNYINTFFGIYNYDILELLGNGKKFTITWDVAKYHEPVYESYIDPITDLTMTRLVRDGEWKCDGTASHDFYYTTEDRIYIDSVNRSIEKYLKDKASELMDNNVNRDNVDGYKDTKPNSYQSNGRYSSTLVEVDGSWSGEENYEGGGEPKYKVYNITGVTPDIVSAANDGYVSSDYKYVTDISYDILDPYIQITEEGKENMSDVFYGSNPDHNLYENLASNHYYVPLLYPDNKKFPILFYNGYLSFIDGINWYLNGNCEITVKNKVYKCDGKNCTPKYRYRPIDLQEPFPDGKFPANWSKWWLDDYRNQKRVKNTYNNGIFYSINLIHGSNSRGKYAAIGDNDIFDDMNYNSWKNINKNGRSSFITSSYYKLPSFDSYCPLGHASSSGTGCDIYN